MSRHKAYALSPRDCLKTTLFQKWQRMVAPPGKLCWTTDDRKVLKEPNRIPDAQRPANKRRKRKGSSSGAGAGNAGPPAPSKKRSPGPNFSLASQVVSEIHLYFFIYQVYLKYLFSFSLNFAFMLASPISYYLPHFSLTRLRRAKRKKVQIVAVSELWISI